MRALIFFLSICVSHEVFSQRCFAGCMEHLKQPLQGQQDVAARIAKSEEILNTLVGCEAPDFNVKSMTGESLSLQQLRGSVVVINFWFAACEPCIAELPALNKLAEEYRDQDVTFIAFGKDSESRINNFLKEKTFNYKIVSGMYDLVNDYCVIAGWPMNMVVDKNGIVTFIKPGGFTDERARTAAYDMMKPMIDEALTK